MAVQILPRTASGPDTTVRVWPSRSGVGLVVVLGAIFTIALAPRIDTDLWWHMKDGAYIWVHHAVPTRDFLSFTFAGRPLVDQEWASELLLYALYRLAGIWGTIVFFAGVIAATFGLVYIRMRGLRVNPMLALAVLFPACVSSSPTWGARPQILTLFFLAAYSLAIDHYLRRPSRRFLLLFPALMLLWVNAHGGWILGFGLLAIVCLGEWLNARTGREGALSPDRLRDLTVATVASLAVTVLTPNGAAGILYPLNWIVPDSYSNVLTEWVSTDFHQPVFMVFEAMVLLLFVGIAIARPRLSWTHLLTIVAFTHLALSEARNPAVWAVICSPVLALVLQQLLPQPASQSHRLFRPSRERLVNVGLLLLVCVIYPLEARQFVNDQALHAREVTTYPVSAVSYMLHHPLPSATFNAYAWGGYLLWRGYPRYRDFIDGRADTLFDNRILGDYLVASSAAPGWERVLNRYAVRTVLIPRSLPLAQVLAEDHHWRLAYHDATAVLYTRR